MSLALWGLIIQVQFKVITRESAHNNAVCQGLTVQAIFKHPQLGYLNSRISEPYQITCLGNPGAEDRLGLLILEDSKHKFCSPPSVSLLPRDQTWKMMQSTHCPPFPEAAWALCFSPLPAAIWLFHSSFSKVIYHCWKDSWEKFLRGGLYPKIQIQLPILQILTILKRKMPSHKHNQGKYMAMYPRGGYPGLVFCGSGLQPCSASGSLCMHFLHLAVNFTVASSSGT